MCVSHAALGILLIFNFYQYVMVVVVPALMQGSGVEWVEPGHLPAGSGAHDMVVAGAPGAVLCRRPGLHLWCCWSTNSAHCCPTWTTRRPSGLPLHLLEQVFSQHLAALDSVKLWHEVSKPGCSLS